MYTWATLVLGGFPTQPYFTLVAQAVLVTFCVAAHLFRYCHNLVGVFGIEMVLLGGRFDLHVHLPINRP